MRTSRPRCAISTTRPVRRMLVWSRRHLRLSLVPRAGHLRTSLDIFGHLRHLAPPRGPHGMIAGSDPLAVQAAGRDGAGTSSDILDVSTQYVECMPAVVGVRGGVSTGMGGRSMSGCGRPLLG